MTPHAPSHATPVPQWLKTTLILAGVYNLVWGAVAVLAPNWLWDLLGATRPNYPELWQCIGMIVGVYGLGYLIAARDPNRHWPIVFVGLLGKIFGPIGFAQALLKGTFPPAFGWTILTNDLIWWVPFSMLLWLAFKNYGTQGRPETTAEDFATPLEAMTATRIDSGEGQGRTLLELSNEAPRLVAFLRHTGCTFCREAATDLSARRAAIEATGTRLVVILLSASPQAQSFLASYNLADISLISDPAGRTYRAFGLRRGSLWQLFGPANIWRGFIAGILNRHGVGTVDGDAFQMPGTFLISKGQIVRAAPAQSASDRPDYTGMACSLQ
jgi:peroxiredoxin